MLRLRIAVWRWGSRAHQIEGGVSWRWQGLEAIVSHHTGHDGDAGTSSETLLPFPVVQQRNGSATVEKTSATAPCGGIILQVVISPVKRRILMVSHVRRSLQVTDHGDQGRVIETMSHTSSRRRSRANQLGCRLKEERTRPNVFSEKGA